MSRKDERKVKGVDDKRFYTTWQDAEGDEWEGPDIHADSREEAESKLQMLRHTITILGEAAG